MLHTRQLIPALTLRDAHGRNIHAWDFKSKKNLVIAFLDADCAACRKFVSSLAEHAAELEEKDAMVLLAFPEDSSVAFDGLPSSFICGATTSACGAQAFLGEDAPAKRECGVFVTDRYGEILGQWPVTSHGFPPVDRILSLLDLAEIRCEECGVPEWPVEE